MKWRILIHSMTFRRDLGMAYVLAKLLEKMGCECFIAHNNNYLSRKIALWNPHGVFFGTLGRTMRLRDRYPNAKMFYCDFEGGLWGEKSSELRILEEENVFNALSRVYLWSKSLEEIPQ